MKKSIVYAIALMISLGACRKKEGTIEPQQPEVSALTFNFTTSYGSDLIQEGGELYTNYHGEKFSFTKLQYYVSRIVLVDEDGAEYDTDIFKLVNAFDETFQHRTIEDVPNGHYTSIKFYFGVPDPENQTASYDGDLNVSHGMSWTWQFGYIFFKHEGTYSDAQTQNKPISYHLGTDEGRGLAELPLDLVLDGKSQDVTINLNLKTLYGSSSVAKFSEAPTIHSTDASDAPWIRATGAALTSSFEIK